METSPKSWHVALLRPPDRQWSAFSDVASSLVYSLRQLGYVVSFGENQVDPNARNILLGSHHLPEAQWEMLNNARPILYNFEPLPYAFSIYPHYERLLSRFPIWEYAEATCHWWGTNYGRDVPWVPVGYAPTLTRSPEDSGPLDIDVLFYGSMSPRRQKIIEAMKASDLRVVAVFGVTGIALDALVSRSRIILNCHQHDAHDPLEEVRLTYLWANRRAVVSEAVPPHVVPSYWRDAACWVPTDQLVQACRELSHDEIGRVALAQRGYAAVQRRPYYEILGSVLD